MGEEIFVVSNKEPFIDNNRGKDIYPRPSLFQAIRGRIEATCFHPVASALLTCYQLFKRGSVQFSPMRYTEWQRKGESEGDTFIQLLKFLIVLDSYSRCGDVANKSESDAHKKQHL